MKSKKQRNTFPIGLKIKEDRHYTHLNYEENIYNEFLKRIKALRFFGIDIKFFDKEVNYKHTLLDKKEASLGFKK